MIDGNSLIDIGVDWLTCTTANQNNTELVRGEVIELMDEQRVLGNDVRPWGMAGFVGLRCGQMQFGFRGQEILVRLSGALAQKEYRRFYGLAENVSRVDVQLTTCGDTQANRVVDACFKRAREYKKRFNHRATITIIRSDDGSATLYIGKRQSDYYGRIYTKGVMQSSGFPLEAVRAEVEVKNAVAKRLYTDLCASRSPLLRMASFVATWFGSRGVPISELPDTFDLYKGFAPPVDAERRLEWLRTQVRGCVGSLKHLGRTQEVLDALGLADDCVLLQPDADTHSNVQEGQVS